MRQHLKYSLMLLLGLLGFKALPAQAAVDMFLCFEKDDIPGESQDKERKGCIDVLAWSWGSSNSANTQNPEGPGLGKVNVQDISVTKFVDSSSAALLEKVTTGERILEFDLIVRRAGCGPSCAASEYITIKATQIIVSSFSTGGSGGEDRLTENVSFNFQEYEYCYTGQDNEGAPVAERCWAWNIKDNVIPGN